MTVDGTEIDLTSYLRRSTDEELYDHPYVLETALSENPELSFQQVRSLIRSLCGAKE